MLTKHAVKRTVVFHVSIPVCFCTHLYSRKRHEPVVPDFDHMQKAMVNGSYFEAMQTLTNLLLTIRSAGTLSPYTTNNEGEM